MSQTTSLPPVEDASAVTFRPRMQVTYSWTVDKFALLNEKPEGIYIDSPFFSSEKDKGVNWRVSLLVHSLGARARTPAEWQTFSVWINIICCSQLPIFMKANISAKQGGEALQVNLYEMGFRKMESGLRKTIASMKVTPSNSALVMRFELVYFKDVKSEPTRASVPLPPCSFVNDMLSLLDDSFRYDTVIVVGERQFRVHKDILGARSPVFDAMFKHEMAEKMNSKVTIEDVDADAMHEVLRYIYTGKVDHIQSFGEEILKVADKYDLPHLKALCEKSLGDSVKVDNAVDMLSLAELYHADYLHKRAVGCVASNMQRILPSAAWKNLCEKKPYLLQLVLAKHFQSFD